MSIAVPAPPDRQAAYAQAWGFGGAHNKSQSMPVDQWFDQVAAGGSSDVGAPYSQVGIAYACVKRKADAMAMMPMRVSDKDEQIIESGPLAQLAERPNSKLTARNYRRAKSAFLDLFGIAYHINFLAADGEVLGYDIKSPVEIRELKDHGTGEVLAYEYRPVGAPGKLDIIEPERVHRIVDADFGSGDITRPLAARRAVGLAIKQYFKADAANDRSLEHGASGGMGLRSEQTLTPEQKKDLLAQLRERHSGYAKRHGWLLLEGLTVEKLFNSFQEMEFAELKRMTREDIAVGFGLNTLVLGYQATGGLGSGQTLDAAHLIVWTHTHLPRAEWLAEEWGEAVLTPMDGRVSVLGMLAERRGPTITERKVAMRRTLATRAKARGADCYAWFDPSGVPVLQRAALELAKQASEWIDKGVPLNQVLRAYDIPFEEVSWGDTWWRAAGLVDVQDTTPLIDDPPGNPTGPQLLEDEPEVDEVVPDEDLAKALAVVRREVSEEQLSSLWHAWRLSWSGLDRATRSKVSRHFSELFRQVKTKLDAMPQDRSAVTRDLVAEVIFDLIEANNSLLLKVGPLLREATELGGTQAMTEHAQLTGMDAADPFRIDDPQVVASLRRRELEITNVNRTLRNQTRAAIEAGLTNGESIGKITERVRKVFNAAGSRASTIARTEVGRSVEEARHLGRGQAGTPLKSWLWSRKETGRENHMQAEAETLAAPVPNSQKFVLPQTGNTCDHPRATGTAEDDINCGCTTIARFPGDSIKSAITGYLSRGFVTHVQLIEQRKQS